MRMNDVIRNSGNMLVKKFNGFMNDRRGSIIEYLLIIAVFALITWGAGTVFKQEVVGTTTDKGTVYTVTEKLDSMVNSIEVK